MKKNKYSVVICSYNSGKYIVNAIESVKKNIDIYDELIIINDGSTDNTETLLLKYKDTPQIKIIGYKKNKGLASARNTGWKNASNDIIFFIDADAELPDYMLNKLDKIFSENYDADAVTGRGIESDLCSVYDLWRKEFFSQTQGNKVVINPEYFSGLCMALKKKCLEKLNGFSEMFTSHAEDVEFALRFKKMKLFSLYDPDLFVYHKRTDDFESLKKMVFNHVYWSIEAGKLHNQNKILKYFAATLKLFVKYFIKSIKLKNKDLFFISLSMIKMRMKAVLKAV
ncbi:glycosyltransferase family 2 protein [Candidatus Dependentiae bacterium]|nr:glycosyltransferase family 2 protein [Candidatus Dependentiae bacterium]